MLQIILRLIGAIIVLFGVVLVYDARIITKKLFGFGDQNEATNSRYKKINFYKKFLKYLTIEIAMCYNIYC